MTKLSILPLLLVAASAQAVTVEKYVTRGGGADGFFSTAEECGQTDAYVSGYQSLQRSGSNAAAWAGGWISISSWDWCTGEGTYTWISLDGASFSANQTRSASLAFSGFGWSEVFLGCEEGTDENGEPWHNCQWDYVQVPVSVDVAWTADGVYSGRGVSSNNYNGPDYRVHSRYNGANASANLSGSIVVDGKEYADGATYSYGGIYQNNSGDIAIFRY